MILHHLKLIFRSLWAKKIYTTVILLSLTIGFVCSNILISFLVHETHTDDFHAKGERIFQFFSNDPFGDNGKLAFTGNNFPQYVNGTYPEVEDMCQVGSLFDVTLSNENERFQDVRVIAVDTSFMSMFDYPILHGGKYGSLGHGKIVLSRDKAIVLFGEEEVIGREVTFTTTDTTVRLQVSAVLDRSSENSHLVFDALVSHEVVSDQLFGGATYALLRSHDASADLTKKINADPARPGLLGPGSMTYSLIPLADSYFSPDNKMPYMKTRSTMFMRVGYIVCGFVLFIAGFNFVNLFMLFWQSRQKEVGIRKTLGVSPKHLLAFSVSEAAIYILIAGVLSALSTLLLLPLFNSVFDATLVAEYLLNKWVVMFIASVLLITGLVVAGLSVMKQWTMKPVRLMSTGTTKVVFSKSLMMLQFVIAIALAICAVTVVRQIEYVKNAPLGFNRNIIQLSAPDRKAELLLNALKTQVADLPGVTSAAIASGNPISGNNIVRYDLEDGNFYSPFHFEGDEDFMRTLDLKLLEGTLPSESNRGKLINQTLARQFNMTNPIGEKVPGTDATIIGVVADFTCSSFKEQIPPVVISFQKEGHALIIGCEGNSLARLIPELETAWKKTFPEYWFNPRIIQEDLIKKYREDVFFFRIVIAFTVVSVVLSCFGLFALSWAVTQSRTKEIGIRKVLGATIGDILFLLTQTFTKRIALAFLIAAPMAYYLMNQWLQRFSNRLDMDMWTFIVPAGLTAIVAGLTLGAQTIKASLTNPVDEIRNE